MGSADMSIPTLSEATLREYASADSLQRGTEYYRHGAVTALTQRGMTLEAEVEGSEPEPYRVRVTFDANGVSEATCTCPYDWGGWCKHIVAALLAALKEPASIDERPPLEQVLSGLDRETLQDLVLYLVQQNPHLADTVEGRIAVRRAATTIVDGAGAERPARPAPIDPEPIRRQVRSIFRGMGRYGYDYYHLDGVLAETRRLLEQAEAFVKADAGENALVILEAITEPYVDNVEMFDDSDGHVGDFIYELGRTWTEALLSADLSASERRTWGATLRSWQSELSDYGMDEGLDSAIVAAEQGWDDPQLQLILQGEITDLDEPAGTWDEDDEGYAEDEGDDGYPSLLDSTEELTRARLDVLERRGRYQECLNLARAMGQGMRYATMLVRLDRAEEAVQYSLTHLTRASDSLAVAMALREHGDLDGALRVAEHGLTLQERRAGLGVWLRDLAAEMGRNDLALQGARVAFDEGPSLSAYQRMQELAGEQWPEVREQLLARLRRIRSYYPQGEVDIFLHEGLFDDAIAAVDQGATHTIVERVVDAVLTSRPEWAIAACRKQAEPIMDEGRAQYYAAAAGWLRKAATAYRAAGREDEWRAYRADLMQRHARKYKLMPLLKALPA